MFLLVGMGAVLYLVGFVVPPPILRPKPMPLKRCSVYLWLKLEVRGLDLMLS